jgi:uracil-DNA glycosylase family 4
MIIGQEPGKSELTSGRAFAGQSGKRLDEWLVAAGAARRHPRAGIYFTSVLKCPCPSSRYFRVMARNCSGFLRRQIETVKPDLIITLGKEAFELFNFRRDQFETAQCNPYYTRNEVLLTGYGFHFWILHLPHPSGANRWHNDQANRRRLDGALRFVTGFLGKGE